jgi:ribosomal protein L37E
MAKKEMERTCNRCANVWYVSLDVAKEKKPGNLEMFGARMEAKGERATLWNTKSSGEMAVRNLENKADRVQRNSTCPSCGSQSFKERKVKV